MRKEQDALLELSRDKDRWEQFKRSVDPIIKGVTPRTIPKKSMVRTYNDIINLVAENMTKGLPNNWEVFETATIFAKNFVDNLIERDLLVKYKEIE